MEKAHGAFFVYDPWVKVPAWCVALQQLEDTMQQQVQPDGKEKLEEDMVTPLIQPDHEDQPDEKTAKSLIQPNLQEQPDENIAISWIKNILSRIKKSG